MYESIGSILKKQKIKIECGLTEIEILNAERRYGVAFPIPLRILLKEFLPIDEGFYNWRDDSDKNVAHVLQHLNWPKDSVLQNLDEISWSNNWGAKPRKKEQEQDEIIKRLQQAPQMIPVYRHRFIPAVEGSPPVFSIYGWDIIYYGETLFDYFLMEFGKKEQRTGNSIQRVPFWSDIM